MPDEQREPTRVELRAAYEAGFEASGEGWNGEYLGPKVEYPACLDKGFAEWLSEQPASAPSEQKEGEARVDLAERLQAKSNVEQGLRPAAPTNLPGPDLYHLGRAEAFAEAAEMARSTRTTEGEDD